MWGRILAIVVAIGAIAGALNGLLQIWSKGSPSAANPPNQVVSQTTTNGDGQVQNNQGIVINNIGSKEERSSPQSKASNAESAKVNQTSAGEKSVNIIGEGAEVRIGGKGKSQPKPKGGEVTKASSLDASKVNQTSHGDKAVNVVGPNAKITIDDKE